MPIEVPDIEFIYTSKATFHLLFPSCSKSLGDSCEKAHAQNTCCSPVPAENAVIDGDFAFKWAVTALAVKSEWGY